jgi:manganese efflux pump family protein
LEGRTTIDLVNVIALAFALAFDAFGVSVAVGITLGQIDRWTVFRLSWHFGFMQFGMPIVGWLAGSYLATWVGSFGSWLAAAVLFVIGARLIWEQREPEKRKWHGDPSRGASLIILMFATSIDALAAGLSLALVGVQILYPSIIIGIVAAVMSVVGLAFGHMLGLRFSRLAGVLGGLILIALAIKALV